MASPSMSNEELLKQLAAAQQVAADEKAKRLEAEQATAVYKQEAAVYKQENVELRVKVNTVEEENVELIATIKLMNAIHNCAVSSHKLPSGSISEGVDDALLKLMGEPELPPPPEKTKGKKNEQVTQVFYNKVFIEVLKCLNSVAATLPHVWDSSSRSFLGLTMQPDLCVTAQYFSHPVAEAIIGLVELKADGGRRQAYSQLLDRVFTILQLRENVDGTKKELTLPAIAGDDNEAQLLKLTVNLHAPAAELPYSFTLFDAVKTNDVEGMTRLVCIFLQWCRNTQEQRLSALNNPDSSFCIHRPSLSTNKATVYLKYKNNRHLIEKVYPDSGKSLYEKEKAALSDLKGRLTPEEKTALNLDQFETKDEKDSRSIYCYLIGQPPRIHSGTWLKSFVEQISAQLAVLHAAAKTPGAGAAGTVHQDISPRNIIQILDPSSSDDHFHSKPDTGEPRYSLIDWGESESITDVDGESESKVPRHLITVPFHLPIENPNPAERKEMDHYSVLVSGLFLYLQSTGQMKGNWGANGIDHKEVYLARRSALKEVAGNGSQTQNAIDFAKQALAIEEKHQQRLWYLTPPTSPISDRKTTAEVSPYTSPGDRPQRPNRPSE